tara:strand:- start:455 stop:1198 length:744 start_codon:yes stop_codon:yes gene_type:complete
MNAEKRINIIKDWILSYIESTRINLEALVVGVSGGIDSSVVSAICAKTGINTIATSMPIKQKDNQHSLSIQHQDWLKRNYKNIECPVINLDDLFNKFQDDLSNYSSEIGFANSRSRIRMATLYQIAKSKNGIVVGTGNKVEDFGVGFYTKYGDGGVDISPIADCTKTQVWEMGKELGILESIINAKPTDGLWDDGRNDEDQLGLSYTEIEEAMKNSKSKYYEKYLSIRKPNLHKMLPIPVCKFEKDE